MKFKIDVCIRTLPGNDKECTKMIWVNKRMKVDMCAFCREVWDESKNNLSTF